MKLTDLATEHPGGWADILAALENHAGESRTVQVSKGGITLGTKIEVADVLTRLKKLDYPVSGLLASAAGMELVRAHLPLPGQTGWSSPAEVWFTAAA